MVMNNGFCVAFDIGGTETSFVVVDGKPGRVTISKFATPKTVVEFSAKIREVVQTVLSGFANQDLQGIILAFPGNSKDGELIKAPNLKELVGLKPQEAFSQFGVPVVMMNDADAGAYHIYRRLKQHGQKPKTVISLLPGTGLGGGIVFPRGQIFLGVDNLANEVGHVSMADPRNFGLPESYRPPEKCGCGKKNCYELICSIQGLERLMECLVEETRFSDLALAKQFAETTSDEMRPFLLSLRTVADEQKNPLAMEIFFVQIRAIAYLANSLNQLFNPQLIELGGGLADTSDRFRTELMDELRRTLAEIGDDSIPIAWAPKEEKESAQVLGAAAYLIDHLAQT